MLNEVVVIWALLLTAVPVAAQVGIGISLPHLSIGINLPMYPELVPVPGYPVYYAPRVDSNYFFYDGMYWVYQDDIWYSSAWYNGPWSDVPPEFVPLYILRIPVRYYRAPPSYFQGWVRNAPPRWDDHWGNDWAQRRSGWNRWNRNAAPAPAPLPVYQRKYSGPRYPPVAQQHALQNENYRYQPRDPVVRQHSQMQRDQPMPPARPSDREGRQQERAQWPRENRGGVVAQPMPQAQPRAPVPPPAAPERGEARQRVAPPQAQMPAQIAPPRREAPPPAPAAMRGEAFRPQGREPGNVPRQAEQAAPHREPAQSRRPEPGQEVGQNQGQGRERDSGESRGEGRGEDRRR